MLCYGCNDYKTHSILYLYRFYMIHGLSVHITDMPKMYDNPCPIH